MLTTDKNEIIESICIDLEGASDSALAQLAETFGVPLQDYSEPILKKSPHALNHAMGKFYTGFGCERHSEQTVYIRVPVVKKGGRYEGRTVVVKGILVPNNEYPGKAVTVLNIGSHSTRGKNRHSLLINNKTVLKRLKGKKIKLVEQPNARNRKVYSVEFEKDL